MSFGKGGYGGGGGRGGGHLSNKMLLLDKPFLPRFLKRKESCLCEHLIKKITSIFTEYVLVTHYAQQKILMMYKGKP